MVLVKSARTRVSFSVEAVLAQAESNAHPPQQGYQQDGNRRSAELRNRPQPPLVLLRCPSSPLTVVRSRIPLQPLQVGSHLRRALVPQVAVFLQRLVDDPFQFGWRVRVEPHGSRSYRFRRASKITPQVLPTNGDFPAAISYMTAPKENRSVRAIEPLPARLLRGHVGKGANRHPRAGEVLLVDRRRLRLAAAAAWQ